MKDLFVFMNDSHILSRAVGQHKCIHWSKLIELYVLDKKKEKKKNV